MSTSVVTTVCATPTRIELSAGAAEPVLITVTEQLDQDISTDTLTVAFTKGETGEPSAWLTGEPVSAVGNTIVVRLRITRGMLPDNGYYTAWTQLVDGADIFIRRMTRAIYAA